MNVISSEKVELGVVIGRRGRSISAQQANEFIKGYVLGLDLTARNLQDEAKKNGLPWCMSKGYDTFTPLGNLIEKNKISDPHRLRLILRVSLFELG